MFRIAGDCASFTAANPATWGDAIDVPFEVETDGVRQRYNLIDTAGIRKRRRIKDAVEFFSVNRADKAIERCDLAVLVMDAAEGVTEQDKKICDRITDAGCACVIVVNKWDLFQAGLEKARKREAKKTAAKGGRKLSRKKQEELMYEEFGKWVKSNLFFIDYAPVIFTSAIEGFQLDRLLEAIRYVSSQLQKTTPTSLLNRSLQAALERSPAMVILIAAVMTAVRPVVLRAVKSQPPAWPTFQRLSP